jgi:TonB family protein
VSLIGSLSSPETPIPEPKKTPKKESALRPKPQKPKQSKESLKGGSGLGAKVEGTEGFEYSYYLSMILSKIGENWRNPYQGAALRLITLVEFKISREGKIYDVRVEESSGDGVYDQAALRAVYATRTLPPLPPEFGGEYLKVHLEFEYSP